MNIKLKITGLWILVLFSACRKEKQLILEESEIVTEASPNASPKGFYLLNEGNMNANKASLDYLDFTTGKYRRNIYAQINPEITKGLGDVGNDLKIYGSKLYAVLNVSNKIEVLDVRSGRRITQIDLNNCRYITFHKNKAYVSAYLGNIGDPSSPQGIVAEIDTATLTINRKVKVGRQPEEMAVVGNKLYVANSGGYSPPDYETTISVIDIPSFSETEKIPVAINLHRLKADKYGDLYVSSRGDYYDIPSQLFVIETQNHTIKKTFDIPVSEIIIQDDLAYIYSSTFNYQSGTNYISYRMLDVKNETILDRSFITDGTNKKIIIPYGIAVNPQTKEIFITDARDYVTPGVLYCFNSELMLVKAWWHR